MLNKYLGKFIFHPEEELLAFVDDQKCFFITFNKTHKIYTLTEESSKGEILHEKKFGYISEILVREFFLNIQNPVLICNTLLSV